MDNRTRILCIILLAYTGSSFYTYSMDDSDDDTSDREELAALCGEQLSISREMLIGSRVGAINTPFDDKPTHLGNDDQKNISELSKAATATYRNHLASLATTETYRNNLASRKRQASRRSTPKGLHQPTNKAHALSMTRANQSTPLQEITAPPAPPIAPSPMSPPLFKVKKEPARQQPAKKKIVRRGTPRKTRERSPHAMDSSE